MVMGGFFAFLLVVKYRTASGALWEWSTARATSGRRVVFGIYGFFSVLLLAYCTVAAVAFPSIEEIIKFTIEMGIKFFCCSVFVIGFIATFTSKFITHRQFSFQAHL